MEIFGEQNKSTKTVCTASSVQAVIVIRQRKRELVSLSLWASLRSLATMNINVVKLSLNGNNISWATSCFKYEQLLDDWLDLTVLEAGKRGPALKNRLVGDAKNSQRTSQSRISEGRRWSEIFLLSEILDWEVLLHFSAIPR